MAILILSYNITLEVMSSLNEAILRVFGQRYYDMISYTIIYYAMLCYVIL